MLFQMNQPAIPLWFYGATSFVKDKQPAYIQTVEDHLERWPLFNQ